MKRDSMMEKELETSLAACTGFSSAYCFETLDSTNTTARELALQGAPEGTLVLAKGQTQGRGRMGRTFYSPQGDGLYMSLVLQPKQPEAEVGLITACASVAVRRAVLALTGAPTEIKWVNDVLYQGKKLCGILAEGQFSPDGELLHMILGIGLNLKEPQGGYAEEICGKTTSLKELAPDRRIDAVLAATAVCKEFFALYANLFAREFLTEYAAASCLLGKDISYQKNGVTYFGKALSITDNAELLVQQKDGSELALSAGEVSLVRPQNVL